MPAKGGKYAITGILSSVLIFESVVFTNNRSLANARLISRCLDSLLIFQSHLMDKLYPPPGLRFGHRYLRSGILMGVNSSIFKPTPSICCISCRAPCPLLITRNVLQNSHTANACKMVDFPSLFPPTKRDNPW